MCGENKMSVSRKDDHIALAEYSQENINSLDNYEFIYSSTPSSSVDLTTMILGTKFDYPFYINAMTGGNTKGNEINYFLARLASVFNLPFFIGSQSLALKDANIEKEYRKLRLRFPTLFIVANVNPNTSVAQAQRAINMLSANGLAVHHNLFQELAMAEGDRDFSMWNQNIKNIITEIKVPVIVKEVGYGFTKETIATLYSYGLTYIDISGKGGTNFTRIELKRNNQSSSPLLNEGVFTDESINNALEFKNLVISASGGVNNAERIVKALCLGATNVGMAFYFLKLTTLPFDQAVAKVNKLIEEIQTIMKNLNVETISQLNRKHLKKLI